MKRTLTAAAVLASSAGALGFAGTATAAESPEFPADLPVDSNVAKTAFHLAGTMHSATQMVGDVVPVEEQLTGREVNGRDLSARDLSARDAGARELGGKADGTNPISAIGDLATGTSLDDVAGWFVPGEGTTKPAPNGAPGSSSTTGGGTARDLLPAGGADSGVTGVVDQASTAVPQLVGETLPTQPLPDKSATAKAAPQRGIVGDALLKGVLPAPGQQGSVVDELGKVVTHGPLGGAGNLGGS